MCIAILLTAGKTLTDEQVRNCWTANPEGAGLLYAKNGVLVVKKEVQSFRKFRDLLENERAENLECNMLVHFRIRTSGKINEVNTHPHIVDETIGFIHNGMLPVASCDKYSDTVGFRKILQGLPKGFIHNPSIMSLVEYLCDGSKLVFLDKDGNYTIIGEKEGHWVDGVWFSNFGHCAPIYRPMSYWTGAAKTKNEIARHCKMCGFTLFETEITYCDQCIEDNTGRDRWGQVFETEITYCDQCIEDNTGRDRWGQVLDF